MAFQETEYYKEKAKHRYKIEAKNSELKIYTVMIEQYHTVLPICKCKVCNSNFYSQLKKNTQINVENVIYTCILPNEPV